MSSLRPLVKPEVNLAQPRPAGRPPTLDFLPLAKLRIDDSYQRTIERKGLATIVRICNEFDWNRFAPLIVARIAGKDEHYAIIDGQHRATAALLRGFDLVPCAIVNASAMEQPAIFAAVNGNVTPITILQLFKAARASKAEWAMEVDGVCKDAGLVPLVYPRPKSVIRPFETMAIGTLRRNIARFGVADVTRALKQAARQPDAADPGFWTSGAIDYAVAEWRTEQGKRQQPERPADGVPLAQRIVELRKRGHSRFAIQSALGCKLSEIEAALSAGGKA
jgi:hypothetical protein